jgi:hypothetical protein
LVFSYCATLAVSIVLYSSFFPLHPLFILLGGRKQNQ